eukprot:scaffold18474_cov107-Isochrysis_galbana.AAC.8
MLHAQGVGVARWDNVQMRRSSAPALFGCLHVHVCPAQSPRCALRPTNHGSFHLRFIYYGLLCLASRRNLGAQMLAFIQCSIPFVLQLNNPTI